MPEPTLTKRLSHELNTVRKLRKLQQHQRLHRSRLDHYQAEIEQLVDLGASYPDIVVWLKLNKRITVHATTVSRRVRHWRSE